MFRFTFNQPTMLLLKSACLSQFQGISIKFRRSYEAWSVCIELVVQHFPCSTMLSLLQMLPEKMCKAKNLHRGYDTHPKIYDKLNNVTLVAMKNVPVWEHFYAYRMSYNIIKMSNFVWRRMKGISVKVLMNQFSNVHILKLFSFNKKV